jgi:hypothetical protein
VGGQTACRFEQAKTLLKCAGHGRSSRKAAGGLRLKTGQRLAERAQHLDLGGHAEPARAEQSPQAGFGLRLPRGATQRVAVLGAVLRLCCLETRPEHVYGQHRRHHRQRLSQTHPRGSGRLLEGLPQRLPRGFAAAAQVLLGTAPGPGSVVRQELHVDPRGVGTGSVLEHIESAHATNGVQRAKRTDHRLDAGWAGLQQGRDGGRPRVAWSRQAPDESHGVERLKLTDASQLRQRQLRVGALGVALLQHDGQAVVHERLGQLHSVPNARCLPGVLRPIDAQHLASSH